MRNNSGRQTRDRRRARGFRRGRVILAEHSDGLGDGLATAENADQSFLTLRRDARQLEKTFDDDEKRGGLLALTEQDLALAEALDTHDAGQTLEGFGAQARKKTATF